MKGEKAGEKIKSNNHPEADFHALVEKSPEKERFKGVYEQKLAQLLNYNITDELSVHSFFCAENTKLIFYYHKFYGNPKITGSCPESFNWEIMELFLEYEKKCFGNNCIISKELHSLGIDKRFIQNCQNLRISPKGAILNKKLGIDVNNMAEKYQKIWEMVQYSLPDFSFDTYMQYYNISPNFRYFDYIYLCKADISPFVLKKTFSIFPSGMEGVHMAELLRLEGFEKLYDFLKQHPQVLGIGEKKIPLDASAKSIQLIRGILLMLKSEGRAFPTNEMEIKSILKNYEKNLNNFIEADKGPKNDFSQIFYIAATPSEDDNGAYKGISGFKTTLQNRYGNKTLKDYSSDSPLGNTISGPDGFVEEVKKYTDFHPGRKALVFLALHGFEDGRMKFSKGYFTKEHIRDLQRLASNGKIVLHIDSCFGTKKFAPDQEKAGNIFLTSSDGGASGGGIKDMIEAFKEDRYISKSHYDSLYSIHKEDMDLLNRTYFDGNSTLVYPPNKDGKAHINYLSEDIPTLKKMLTGKLKNDQILYLLSEKVIKEKLKGDFDGDGMVSYNEARLYQILQSSYSFQPTSYISQYGSIQILT